MGRPYSIRDQGLLIVLHDCHAPPGVSIVFARAWIHVTYVILPYTVSPLPLYSRVSSLQRPYGDLVWSVDPLGRAEYAWGYYNNQSSRLIGPSEGLPRLLYIIQLGRET